MDLLAILFYIFLGTAVGIITGLTPGLHPNTVITVFLGLFFGNPLLFSVMIVSMSVAHSFLDFIPSIMLGAPDPETALSVLPGHRMMMSGMGQQAVKLTVVGGVVSLLMVLAVLPVLAFFIGSFYSTLRPNVHWLLIFLTGFMFLKDKTLSGPLVFLLSGILGYLVLNGGVLGKFALFPMLTGLFGMSMIVKSLKDRVVIPGQKTDELELKRGEIFRGGVIGSLSGILAGLLPGVGAAQATFVSRELVGKKRENEFMIAIGGVNTVVAVLSILALWLIGNPRSGAGVAVQEILTTLTVTDVVILMGAIILAGGLSSIATLLVAGNFIGVLRKINYNFLGFAILVFLVFMTVLFTGLTGLCVLLLSTSLGLFCILSGTRRSYMMGCLILPTILFFV